MRPSADGRHRAVRVRDIESHCRLVKVTLCHCDSCRSRRIVVTLVERAVQVVGYLDGRVGVVDAELYGLAVISISRKINCMYCYPDIVAVIPVRRNHNITGPVLMTLHSVVRVIH